MVLGRSGVEAFGARANYARFVAAFSLKQRIYQATLPTVWGTNAEQITLRVLQWFSQS